MLVGSYAGEGDTVGFVHKREPALALIRLSDIASFVGPTVYRRWAPFMYHMGEVAATGLWVAAIANGLTAWFSEVWGAGLLGLGLQDFRTRSKEISVLAKNDQLPPASTRQFFTELNSVTGYLFEPDPSFDKLAETKKLVDSHTESFPEYRRLYEAFAVDFSYSGKPLPDLKTWVSARTWATSGGCALSGLGKVVFSVDDETVAKLRLVKNLLTQVVTLDDAVEHVSTSFGQQRSKVEVKSETAKLRNIYNFMVWNFMGLFWVLDQLVDKNFPGLTSLGEDFTEQVARLREMLSLTRDHISLPLDWEGFDTQVKLWQIEEAWKAFTAAVPGSEALLPSIIQGINNSGIIVETPEGSVTISQKSGLLSGIPETSLVGARVNSISSSIALQITEFLVPGSCKGLKVRGDDTAVWFASNAAAALFFLIFAACGHANPAKTRAGKEMEFLRLSFNDRGVTGILNRCLAGLIQRKPIAEQTPWERCYRARVVLEQLPTAMRRGASTQLRAFVSHVVAKIAAADGVDVRYISALRTHGGLGLGRPNGAIFKSINGASSIRADPGSWAVDIVTEAYRSESVTPDEAHAIAKHSLEQQIWETDDPVVKQQRRRQEVRLLRVDRIPNPIVTSLLSDEEARLCAIEHSFGAAPWIQVELARLTPLARVRKVKVWSMMPSKLLVEVVDVGKRIHMARGDTVDWLAGKLPVNTRESHPELSHVVDWHTAATFVKLPRTRHYRLLIASLDSQISPLVQDRHKELFSW